MVGGAYLVGCRTEVRMAAASLWTWRRLVEPWSVAAAAVVLAAAVACAAAAGTYFHLASGGRRCAGTQWVSACHVSIAGVACGGALGALTVADLVAAGHECDLGCVTFAEAHVGCMTQQELLPCAPRTDILSDAVC